MQKGPSLKHVVMTTRPRVLPSATTVGGGGGDLGSLGVNKQTRLSGEDHHHHHHHHHNKKNNLGRSALQTLPRLTILFSACDTASDDSSFKCLLAARIRFVDVARQGPNGLLQGCPRHARTKQAADRKRTKREARPLLPSHPPPSDRVPTPKGSAHRCSHLSLFPLIASLTVCCCLLSDFAALAPVCCFVYPRAFLPLAPRLTSPVERRIAIGHADNLPPLLHAVSALLRTLHHAHGLGWRPRGRTRSSLAEVELWLRR
jgi:hypothetical protein